MRVHSSILLIGILTVLGGCSDESSPNDENRSPSELNIVKLSPASPPLFSAEESFYAVQGEDREIRISFQDAAGAEGEEFLRLRVRPGSLQAGPDGTPIAAGDSVLITVRVEDPANLLFEMEPAGLTFNPSEPAELKIHYAHADHDFNEDGSVNSTDDQIRTQLGIWRQETLSDPFVRLGSVNEVTLEEVNVDILGFTRYAVAY